LLVKVQDSFGAWKFSVQLVGESEHHKLLAATLDDMLCVQLRGPTASWQLAGVTLATRPSLSGVPYRVHGDWISEDYTVTQSFDSLPGEALQIPESCALGGLVRLEAQAVDLPEAQPTVDLNVYLTPIPIIATARAARVEAVLAELRTSNVTAHLARQHEGILRYYLRALAGETSMVRCATAIDAHWALTEIDRLLDALAAGRNVLAARRGTFLAAYISRADGTPQPVRLTVPQIYRGELPIPLLVILHDAGTAYSERFPEAGDDAPFITARVHARGRSGGYLGLAELDVLEAIAFVTNVYSVDTDRIYLIGSGMGGYGVWRLATRHPGLFAAVAAFNGYSAGLPLVNLRNLATRVVHGGNDMQVPVVYSRAATETLSAQACPVVFDELVGLGYHVHRQSRDLRVSEWLLNHRRVTTPREVIVTVTHAGVTQCHWLSVHARRDPRRMATARARFFGAGELIVNLENVAAAAADIDPENADPDSLLTVVVNGRRREFSAPLPPTVYFTHTSNGVVASRVPPAASPGPRAYRPGSWQQFFNGDPVLIVRGTRGTPAATNRIAQCAGVLAHWSFVNRVMDTGNVRVKDDVAVTEDDLLNYNLVLLGTPEQNEVTAALAGELITPVRNGALTLGATSYPLDQYGLWLTQYNPRVPQRSVWLWSSLQPGFYHAEAAWLADWAFEAEDPPDLLVRDVVSQAYVRAVHFNRRWEPATNAVAGLRLADCGASVSTVVARIGEELARGTRSQCAWLDTSFSAAVSSVWSMSVHEAVDLLLKDSTLVACTVASNDLDRLLGPAGPHNLQGGGSVYWAAARSDAADPVTIVTTPAGLRSMAAVANGALQTARYIVLPVRPYVTDALLLTGQ
jgi:hypothetical protein